MVRLRDRAIGKFDLTVRGHWKAPGLQVIQGDLARLPREHQEIARRALIEALDTGIHDFLFGLVEAHDFEEGIEILVDGRNVVDLSDGLQMELGGEDGWIDRFSQYPAAE